ncbi:HECT E3 ubiquitin ligase [Thraustotheca clavata]|uniref:HECT-type E3 ubiquitin transferase n=1 Tax=Thraustotheca clavata TaxID=74557 RepID=A0A1W0ACA4_9STRA|nr:HECT E3 ubiquitin ligase [Thraustotheca clavata]
MLVEGMAGGGFASVGAPDCIVYSGRWYYEATLLTSGCIQIGWADTAFTGASERGTGVGDGPHSWAYDGWRQQKWHGTSSPYGLKWKVGDVVGCGVDCDAGFVFFCLNGQYLGIAFRGIDFSGGIYPCASFNRRERLSFNFGGVPFHNTDLPHFEPIIQRVLTDDYLKGDLEDCLEESVGEEQYMSDSRYFGKDLKTSATIPRNKPGSQSSSSLSTEWLLLTRQLAILHARKALLSILSQWPADVDIPEITPEWFVTFLKLVAPYSQSLNTSEVSNSTLGQMRAMALYVLRNNASMAAAVEQCIANQVALAGTRKYAKIPWDAPNELAVVCALAQLSDAPWTDVEILQHPNVHFTEWLTLLLLEDGQPEYRKEILGAWLCVLKSPSLCLKDKAAQLLARILPEMDAEDIESLPYKRLVGLCSQRLGKEYAHFPVCSKYLQHLVELTSTLFISKNNILPESSLGERVLAAKSILETLAPFEPTESGDASLSIDEEPDEKQDDPMGNEDDDGPMTPPPPPPVDLAALAQMNAEDKDGMSVDVPQPGKTRLFIPSFPVQLVDTSLLQPAHIAQMEAAFVGFKVAQQLIWPFGFDIGVLSDDAKTSHWSGSVTQLKVQSPTPAPEASSAPVIPPLGIGCKVKRGPHWKWRDQDGGEGSIGTVEGVSPWSGVEGEGMSVRWSNGSLYTYRWGADGNYDLVHVEVDENDSIIKTYPTPVSSSSASHPSMNDILADPFCVDLYFGMILKLWQDEVPGRVQGIVEWPDFQAVISVTDGVLQLQEVAMLQGEMDMGWNLRFGCERWLPGTKYSLVVDSQTCWGDAVHYAWQDKQWKTVKTQVRLQSENLFSLDPHAANTALQVSSDGQSVKCLSGDSRNLVLGSVGFSTGVHYWELRVDQAEFGSVFLGVCEKQTKGATVVNLNRWQGWGFVNFRATYHNSTERIYGDHFNAGDTIGVCLNMETGKLSFFMDGIKYGEHIVTDLGTAFEGLKHDNQSVRTLYPCIGLRKAGDKVTLNSKWISSPGVPPALLCHKSMVFSFIVHRLAQSQQQYLPESCITSGWLHYVRWLTQQTLRVQTRGRVYVDLDTSIASCQRVCTDAGASIAFFYGDRVRILSKGGRALDAPEEAIVLGVYRQRLWYRVETQGNEGGEEGRSYAWYWDAAELQELILVKRNGIEVASSTTEIPQPASMAYAPLLPEESQALTSLAAYQSLLLQPCHSLQSDTVLIELVNGLCATFGVDAMNLTWNHISSLTLPATMSSFNPASVRARLALLLAFQQLVLHASPLLCFDDSSRTSRDILSLRRLVCTSTKLSIWEGILRSTTTPTPLPSDEYEDPREIRILRINRIQAQASKLALCPAPSDRLRKSVFGQLYREMRTWSDSGFRRAYIGKGHGGQKRAFKVKFLGEGVNDYGGPYRAVFEQIVDELQMDQVEVTKGEQGLLPLLVPCPNRRAGTGMNQDKFVLNPSCGTISVAVGPIALELHRFLGKLIGMAVRHGLQMGLDLPSVVWRPLVGLPLNVTHLREIDVVAANTLNKVQTEDESFFGEQLVFTTHLSDGTEVALVPDGELRTVNASNQSEFVELSIRKRLNESGPQLQALKEGLASVLPMEMAGLFTARELEVLICGRREVDVNLLQQCTEYEDVDPTSAHIQYFWKVLHEMSSEDRTLFLRFVWARSRMPNSAKEFPMNFKIQAPHDQGARQLPDQYLPHAQTCFFSLSLPAYSTKEILQAKLLYAIQNSPNMDADVRLHNAEGWADA